MTGELRRAWKDAQTPRLGVQVPIPERREKARRGRKQQTLSSEGPDAIGDTVYDHGGGALKVFESPFSMICREVKKLRRQRSHLRCLLDG